jgi:hypothetical protein
LVVAPACLSLSQPDANLFTGSIGKYFIGFGARFGLRANSVPGFEEALANLPLGWHEVPELEADVQYSLYNPPPDQDPRFEGEHLLYANSELIARDRASATVLQKFAEHARFHTALYARERLFVHAGVVGWHGSAILIPGRSFSGKTTLVKALVEAGATYYSDEYALLDCEGYTSPYPVPLSLRRADGTSTTVIPALLGGRVGAERLAVKLILLTRYADGAVWRPQKLSPSQAMLMLMDNTVAARGDPQFSMPILRATVSGANTLQSIRGDAESIVTAIVKLLEPE